MNKMKAGAAPGFGRGALAAALLAFSPLAARAVLVTRVVPVQESGLFAPVPEILRDLPVADPCAGADKAVYALESSIVEAQAQQWAYLMKRPGFSVRGLSRKPGSDIAHADLRGVFYKKLASWYAQENVPELSAESMENVNDVSMRIRLVRDLCR